MSRADLSVAQLLELGEHLTSLALSTDPADRENNVIEISDGLVGVNGCWLRENGDWTTTTKTPDEGASSCETPESASTSSRESAGRSQS